MIGDEAGKEDFSWAHDSTVPVEQIEEEQSLSQTDDQGSEAAKDEPEECGEEVAEVVLEPEAAEAEESPAVMQTNEPEQDEPIDEPAETKAAAPEPEAPIAKPASSGDLYSEITPFPDEGISRPNEALDAPAAGVQPPSIFDSVRIMDSDPKSSHAVPASSAPAAAEAPATPGDADEGAKSFTTPNIGGVDTDGKRSSKLKPLDEGTILNSRYEIVRKIGGGGMGAVYLASDNNLGGVLRAVKEMVQTHIEEEQQDKAINDFKRESMILSTLDHPSIPTIYDYFFDEKESRFYLVMKYISGGDLSSRHPFRARGPDRRADDHRVGDPDRRRARLPAQPPFDHRLSRPEALERNARRQYRPGNADRFRDRALDQPDRGKGRNGRRDDGLCAAGAVQRKCRAALGYLQPRIDDVSSPDGRRSAE